MASDTNVSSATFESRLTMLETNFAVFVQEMKDFKNEMRERDNQRHAEIQATNAKIDGMSKHIRNLSYTAIGAIAAMVLTVLFNLPK